MRPLLLLLILLLAPAIPAVDLHLGAYVGGKQGDSDLQPVDQQFEYGLQAHVRPPIMPVGIQANWFEARRNGDSDLADVSQRLVTNELQLGLGRVFDPLVLIHPFIAAGVNRVILNSENTGAVETSETASAWGYWAQGGAFCSLGLMEIGVVVGWSRADVELNDITINAGGKRLGLILGVGF